MENTPTAGRLTGHNTSCHRRCIGGFFSSRTGLSQCRSPYQTVWTVCLLSLLCRIACVGFRILAVQMLPSSKNFVSQITILWSVYLHFYLKRRLRPAHQKWSKKTAHMIKLWLCVYRLYSSFVCQNLVEQGWINEKPYCTVCRKIAQEGEEELSQKYRRISL